jgi:hypothetical protein
MIRKHNGMISVDKRKLMTSESSIYGKKNKMICWFFFSQHFFFSRLPLQVLQLHQDLLNEDIQKVYYCIIVRLAANHRATTVEKNLVLLTVFKNGYKNNGM